MPTIERYFPNDTIGIVSQTGAELTKRERGVFVHLHTREGEDIPCCAEVFGNSEDHHAEIGLWFEGKRLVDYDGVFEIPPQLTALLKELGYDVSDHEEPLEGTGMTPGEIGL